MEITPTIWTAIVGLNNTGRTIAKGAPILWKITIRISFPNHVLGILILL